jgi:hypothetical protein
MSIGGPCVVALLLLPAVFSTAAVTPPLQQTMNMSEVIALLQQQQKDLAQQRKLLEAQSRQIAGLKQELDVLRAPSPVASDSAIAGTQTPTPALTVEPLATGAEAKPPRTQEQVDSETRKSVAKAQADDPSRDLLADFTGAWRLPGTDAALRIGGYVKTDLVYNFDPLEIEDRFIVGSIPVGETNTEDIEAQSSITASQSRLNFDLREPTELGVLRAFIEGDFAGDNDTFRLRHAFGQWDKVLIGKTWSTFMDAEASPEELDFEGLNGRISVRQPQIRFTPRLGKKYEFQFSLEDPNPQVQNGQGVTRTPDVVANARFAPHERLHVKLALIGREIRAQRAASVGSGVEKKFGGGASLSGRFSTPRFDDRDGLLFQLSAGNGIGRYVNDLSSVGSFDGIFNTANGDLKLFDIVSGYLSWQHWWPGSSSLRSNLTFGVVEIDNPDFVEGDAYKRTLRFSTNIFWAPTERVELGAEYMWGRRENEDGEEGDATQIQLGARYLF